ncbi:hypothetical protein V6N13_085278 [Hibiscus sabdariffa]|uniref:RRM domain-containing protein n=1 Tax=Hibiscus sabdariffa TaxID=183260 RepID=A0ABR2D151_9ROSI
MGSVQQQRQGDDNQQGKSAARTVTLIVFNQKLHSKGLWFLFNHHGEVVDSFIPRKRSLRDYRFGFVRFVTMEDAMRALDRLDGFTIYDSRVRVHLARHQSCHLFGRKSAPSKSLSMRTETLQDKENQQSVHSAKGVVDGKNIKILKNCMVGWCYKFLTVESLARKLREDGLRDISIMRLAGSAFLLMFKDKENLNTRSLYRDGLRSYHYGLKMW